MLFHQSVRMAGLVLIMSLMTIPAVSVHSAQANQEDFQISCEKALDLISQNRGKKDFVIIDFRPEHMYVDSHIEGAVFYDVFSPAVDEWLNSLDKSKTYLIYCTIGHRSGIAFSKMKEMGFERVFHMNRGITKWKEMGYKTVSGLQNSEAVVPFNPDEWQVYNGKFEEYLGRQSFLGTARLKDVEFENGSIEFDVAVTGARSYPGSRSSSVLSLDHDSGCEDTLLASRRCTSTSPKPFVTTGQNTACYPNDSKTSFQHTWQKSLTTLWWPTPTAASISRPASLTLRSYTSFAAAMRDGLSGETSVMGRWQYAV